MDSVETQHNETKEYPFARFISDVGGSLGLFMGMNLSILSFIIYNNIIDDRTAKVFSLHHLRDYLHETVL